MPNVPWNKGRLTGQKRPLKPKDVWAIRVRLQLEGRKRDLALFNLAIDSKLSHVVIEYIARVGECSPDGGVGADGDDPSTVGEMRHRS